MYHHQPPIDGRSPSAIENHLTSAYSLTTLISSASIFGAGKGVYGSKVLPDTTASVYIQNILSSEETDHQLDNLIDEVGEAEDDRIAVGIESEDYSLDLEKLGTASSYFGSDDEDNLYAALEPPPHEIYLNSLLDTEIDVARLYDSKLRMDLTRIPFYEISYYDGRSTEEIIEPKAEGTETEPIFTANTPSVEDSEPEDEPNSTGDLESRLGLRRA